MKKALLLSVGVVLVSACMSRAQAPSGALPPSGIPAFRWTDLADRDRPLSSNPCYQDPWVWASADYLYWWVKNAPISVPLVATGDPTLTPNPGALGQPGTAVLSPHSLDFGPQSGGRVTVGGWLDPERSWGLEASGFLLETRQARNLIASDGAGNPRLYNPYLDPRPGFGETTFPLSAPGVSQGSVLFSATTQLWGAEANGLYRLVNNDSSSFSLLAGFRYLDLLENLEIDSQVLPLSALVGSSTGSDRFTTRNQLFGGQLGAKFEYRSNCCFVSLLGKVALADNHESVTNNTAFSLIPAPPPPPVIVPVAPLGVFVQGTNIGRHDRDQFAVIPEVQLQIGIDLNPNVRIFAGYDFLYISNVVRPGDQIDRTVNGSQINGGVLSGPARPATPFNTTDFWAQGINAGLQIKF
jgi:Putative beta barrel porin-7 (BBP7)